MDPAPSFRGRLWRWTKRLSLLTTVAVAAAVPTIGIGLPVAVRSSWARQRTEKALSRAFGAPVQVGALSWRWKQGLTAHDVGTTETPGSSFRIDTVRVQPRLSKLLQGKLRLRVTLEKPELVLLDASPLRMPRLPKKGPRVDRLEIVDGTLTLLSRDDRMLRLENLALQGHGWVEDRKLRVIVASLSGSCGGNGFSGGGMLRMTGDGLGGVVELKEAPAPELRSALRALNVTPQVGPLSEPF